MKRLAVGVILVAAAALAGCAQEAADEEPLVEESEAAASDMEHPADALSAEDLAAIDQVRRTAGAWTDLAAARAAGYTNQYPEGCIQTDDGSQGFHFLNDALVDDRIELNQPELVMYEPQADGSMQLIGVDYVIPFDRWTAAEPPELLGRPLMRNEPLGVWALHIWTHRDNPSGMFAPYNPSASCQHADAARM